MKKNSPSTHRGRFLTPILFLVFNRLEATKKVFAQIKQLKPKKLFIAADGYRSDVKGEKNKCESVKKYILDNIDWKCEVKTLFSDKNLGCGLNVSRGITWFFKNVSEGIILEDDCLPNQSFFYFCEKLLHYYRHNLRVFMISGDNFSPESLTNNDSSYYFSNIPHIWGWATWRRAWKKFNFNINDLSEFIGNHTLDRVWNNKKIEQYWIDLFSESRLANSDIWCWKWAYAIWKNNGICINPNINLVSNIGLNSMGTHTLHDFYKELSPPKKKMVFPIKHPKEMKINKDADSFVNKNIFLKNYTYKHILKKIGLFNIAKKVYIKFKKFNKKPA